MNPEDRIQTMTWRMEDGTEVPMYQRYIGEETELWMFGSGVGEYTMFMQIGDSFLNLMDAGEDPCLGRLMCSIGLGITAQLAYKGDYNITWAWGLYPWEIENHIKKQNCRPDLFLSVDPKINLIAEKMGLTTMEFMAGVNTRFFHPLNLNRSGYGYAGVNNKSKEQKHAVLDPILKKLEWIGQEKSELKTLPELNEWYNSKKILFGMVDEKRQNYSYFPSRIPETLATGTPFITYKSKNLEENLGIKYPWTTSSYEETCDLIELIEEDYVNTLSLFKKYSEHVAENHNYEQRLRMIFKKLREL